MAHADILFAPVAALGRVFFHRTVKRAMDMGFTALGLLAIWPLLALVAIAIKLDSRGPVFFVQTRVGKDGQTFGMV
ncbi:MAG: sugar transferase, partial [Paracoccaceae bacterium]